MSACTVSVSTSTLVSIPVSLWELWSGTKRNELNWAAAKTKRTELILHHHWSGQPQLWKLQRTELNMAEPNWTDLKRKRNWGEAKWSERKWSETKCSELGWTELGRKRDGQNWSKLKREWTEQEPPFTNWTEHGWTELNRQSSGVWPSEKRAVSLPSSSVTLEVAALSSKPQLRPSSLFPLHSCPQTFKGYKEIQNKGGRGFQRR